jgi:hypothetical protein
LSDLDELAVPARHLFDVRADYLSRFNRDEYVDAFNGFMDKNAAFYDTAQKFLRDGDGDEQNRFRRLADILVNAADEAAGEADRKSRSRLQGDLNLFAVCFLIPGFLYSGDRVEKLRSQDAMDLFCKTWASHFPDSNISAATMESIDSGFRRKLCYITTSACIALGRGEDCSELQLLKSFRDGYMMQTEERSALVREYYDIAPTIVKRIAKDPCRKKIYTDLWDRYIFPCTRLVAEGKYEECLALYKTMVMELDERYVYTSRTETA